MAALIDIDSWQRPNVFAWLQQAGNISEQEMLTTFNCGIGMLLIVHSDDAEATLESLRSQGEAPVAIGEIVSRDHAAGPGQVLIHFLTTPAHCGPQNCELRFWQGYPGLSLIFAATIFIGGLAALVRLKNSIWATPSWHNLPAAWSGKIQRDMPFPFRLQRRYVDDDATARVGRLAQADSQYATWNAEILHGARQGKRVGRNDASVAFDIHEAFLVEVLGIHGGRMNVRKHLELVGTTHIVTIARRAIRNDFVPTFVGTDLIGLEGFNHALGGLLYNPAVGLDAHSVCLPFTVLVRH